MTNDQFSSNSRKRLANNFRPVFFIRAFWLSIPCFGLFFNLCFNLSCSSVPTATGSAPGNQFSQGAGQTATPKLYRLAVHPRSPLFRAEIQAEITQLQAIAKGDVVPGPFQESADSAPSRPEPQSESQHDWLTRHILSRNQAALPAASDPAPSPLTSGGERHSADVKASEVPASLPARLPPKLPPKFDGVGGEPGQGLSEGFAEPTPLKKLMELESSAVQFTSDSATPLIFDFPVTYNSQVSFWVRYFQTKGRNSFRIWLERSARFLPIIQYELTRAGLPRDLVYVAMIESGFSPFAVSHAGAIGLWQFIVPTGKRYGLKIDWWIDERKDFAKATRAAIHYMTDLYKQFNSWYLVAASYNMGENGVRRLIQKHKTNNFWRLADLGALPNETKNYVPKIIAATLISKAPALYGFREIEYQMPMSFEYTNVPGGTDLVNLASYLGVSERYLKELNPELLKGFVPRDVLHHKIRVPKGSMLTVSQYVRLQNTNQSLN